MKTRKAPRKTIDTKAPAGTWRRHLPAVAGLWALALAAYASSFGSGLVLDNAFLIGSDSRIQAATAHNTALILGREYWYGNSTSDLYRPLTTLSYLFNYAVLGNGPHPAGYHWVNFALHAVNIALVYCLALWILGEIHSALTMAAIWAVHPVLTESVTNIVGRADILAAGGVLMALVCHVQAGRAAGRRRQGWLVGLCLTTAVGVFSKESAIVAPAVVVLYDLAFGRRDWGAWRARMGNYAAAALPCLLFLYVRGRVLAGSLTALIPYTDNPLTGAGFWTARLTALRVIGKYAGLLLWPGSLSSDYSYNQIPMFRAGDLAALAGVVLCALVAAAAVRAFGRYKAVFFFVGLFFVALAPVANFFLPIGTIMAERFLYLPAVGFAGCAALGLRALRPRLPAKAATLLAAAICAALAVRTYARNLDWATDQTIQRSAAQSAPDSFKPHSALATLLAGDAAMAQADRTRAILDALPDERNSMRAYSNVGIGYRTEGDRVAATDRQGSAPWYRKSLDALLRARSIEQAYDRMNRQENLRRGKGRTTFGWYVVYLELGRTYLRLAEPKEALAAFQQGRMRTVRPEFFEETANAYQAMGDSRQAAIALMESVFLDTSQTQLAARLVELYRQTAPRSCAVRETGGSWSIDMSCPLVKEDLCAALRDLPGFPAAAQASHETGCVERQ